MSENVLKSGLTWRSLLIMLCTMIVFVPVSIWLNLSIGTEFAVQAYTYSILLIAIELAYFSGNPLTKQEVATVFVGVSGINWAVGINMIQQAYFSQSRVLDIFGLKGCIPYWVSPLPEAGFYASRSFFHPQAIAQWFGLLGFLAMFLPSLAMFAGLSLGILNKVLYVDEEKLEYPGVKVQAEFCETLTIREPTRLNLFCIFFLVSFGYSLFVYTFPTIGSALGIEISLIPQLWVDWSSEIQEFLPGAIFGIATDFVTLTPAFYLPFYVILCQVIGSLAVWVLGNAAVINLGLTEFSKIYFHGMKMIDVALYANLYVWMLPIIGLGIVVGFSNLRPSIVRRAFSSLRKGGRAGATGIERFFSIWLIVIPMAIAILSNLLYIWYRAPDYPMWPWLPAIYSILLSIPMALLSGRAAGTGINITIPQNLDRIMLLATGYKGFNAWFAGPVIFTPTFFGGPLDVNFKLSQLTESTFTSFMKMIVIVYPISTLVALVFTQLFWSLAQIPSSAYPYSTLAWPRAVMENAAWITRPREIFHLEWILYGALTGLAMYVPLSLLCGGGTAITIMTSILAGMTMLPPFAMNLVIGYVVRRVFELLMGKDMFDKYKFTIVAGISSGSGLAVAIGISSLLIAKSIWVLPY